MGNHIETEKRLPVLVVEDEPDQAQLIQENLEMANAAHDVRVVNSGEKAIAYLSGQGEFSDRTKHPIPFLVLLDIRMPGVGGFGVLRWLNSNSGLLHKLKIVVLSSIQSVKDVEVVHELGATFFWPKADCGNLLEKIQWLEKILGC